MSTKMPTVARMTKLKPEGRVDTVADLWERLGKIPLHRIRMNPPPGKAKVKDAARLLDAANKRLCELIDGVLVEKAMGWGEALLSMNLARWLGNYVDDHDLGLLLGEGGAAEIFPGQVRIPDLSFYSWRHFPQRKLPEAAIPYIFPDLAVEVISVSNTPAEMKRKLQDYFKAGVQLVWYVYPRPKQVKVYTSPESCTMLKVEDTLTGDSLLPGFQLPVAGIFAKPGSKRN